MFIRLVTLELKLNYTKGNISVKLRIEIVKIKLSLNIFSSEKMIFYH